MLTLLISLAIAADLDGDGIDDITDNCDTIANPDQADGNADGYGDACAHPTATVGANVFIARGGYIDAGATVGANTVIVGATVGQGAQVGADAVIYGSIADETPGTGPAIIGTGALLARRATVAAGAIVGDDALVFAAVPIQVRIGDRTVVRRGAELAPLVQVGNDCRLRATVGLSSVIGDRVAIGRSTLGRRVTVHDDVRIGSFVTIGDDAVIGADARIRWRVDVGDSANIGEDVFLARNAAVGDDAIVGDNARVNPEGQVPDASVLPADAVLVDGQPLDQAEVCVDSIDNDGDGNADCFDDDCDRHPACLSESNCSDGLDDDMDSLIDCADVDCMVLGACPGEVECADGIDNDRDGDIDCRDANCWGGPDCQIEVDCDDRIDNDLDGYMDEYDADCGPLPEKCRLAGRVEYDNDADGLPNWRDPDCVPLTDVEQTCADGLDNDANGLIDCEDANCSGSEWCIEDCLDGIDNDGDGDRDCDDSDCIDSPCLVERRILGGTVRATVDRDTTYHSTFGAHEFGACAGQFAGPDTKSATFSFDANFEASIQLRVPTSAGGVVSSTCRGNYLHAGHAAQLTRSYRAAAAPLDAIPVQLDGKAYIASGFRRTDCDAFLAAGRGAAIHVSPLAAFAMPDGGSPEIPTVLGDWDLGTPAYWVARSYHQSSDGTSSSGQCLTVRQRHDAMWSASWDLPAQTHRVSSP